ncbi:Ferredoxin-type protein NapF [Methanosarcinaceae archaeon Ag5]|uniref:Ferredoxin-type protein NapF n=1 Tax=Methanolapillus africanus TaxID=3028297 RepID=A0AAE4MJX9_9EURY|nr:Ferredoxin-type protein NapF [Methanosarcinaceae archaeon Ag5]
MSVQKETEPAKVYFMNFRAHKKSQSKVRKVEQIFKKAGFASIFENRDLVAVKLHVGERGNDATINPVFVRAVMDCIKETGALPFATDTNTLYEGYRKNAVEHVETAILHGFNYSVIGTPVIIADGLKGDDEVDVEVNLKNFKSVKIAKGIEDADAMVVLTHFKGHIMSGFGGAIKNLSMGCASVSGKWAQHSSSQPAIDKDRCTKCGACIKLCPAESIVMEKDGAKIVQSTCLSCGHCMICPRDAVYFDWAEMPGFVDRMVEYAYGAVQSKKGKICYITFLMNITPECDCNPWNDTPIVPDIGILASTDPIALDQACLDLVNASVGLEESDLKCNHQKGGDKFKGVWENTDGTRQLEYGEELGMGTRKYVLIEE